jgi:UDP:flavonoid glycosyltransferase YjiC (YdhE family)
MKIVIITLGSTGDTLPFVALGRRLKAAGHEVAVGAQQAFEEAIRDAGLEFRIMPGDIRAELASEAGQRLHRARWWLPALTSTLELAEKVLADLGAGIVEAAHGAELLVVHRVALMHGYAVANAMGIPCVVVELFPSGLAPTAEFLPAGFGSSSLGGWGNLAVYRLLRASAGRSKMYQRLLRQFCDDFALPRVNPLALYEQMEREQWPIYHAFSAHVVPRPRDWRAGLELIGYLWSPSPSAFRPSAKLLAFLDAGPPPVFIGLGSLMPQEAEKVSGVVATAIRMAKVRAVVQSGWAGLAVEESGTTIGVSSVPHFWLFPKMAAVVHAASAGVTAAGLRAGTPAVAIPAMNDQPFWADRLVKLGVSPGPLRFQQLSAERLAAAIKEACSRPSYRVAARTIARRLRSEDAAGQIVDAVWSIQAGETAPWCTRRTPSRYPRPKPSTAAAESCTPLRSSWDPYSR